MSDTMRPIFRFFGSKWTLAPHYPPPRYPVIVEPFAGSAGYSTRYYDRQIILVERDPKIAELWRWLIAAKPDDVRDLPLLSATAHRPSPNPGSTLRVLPFRIGHAATRGGAGRVTHEAVCAWMLRRTHDV